MIKYEVIIYWSEGDQAFIADLITNVCRCSSLVFDRWHVDLAILRGAAQQFRHFVLHRFQFVEAQSGIGHNEDITGRAVFVDEHPALLRVFSFDLF